MIRTNYMRHARNTQNISEDGKTAASLECKICGLTVLADEREVVSGAPPDRE
jgi:hypothetical protein